MEILKAEFVSSFADVRKCPAPDKPEFAFIGRSNVGKSSLINMLTNRRKLAKTSVTPGKTQTINHFIINDSWYLVDLPGYGFASVSRDIRAGFGKMIEQYITGRENLQCLFILIDARHAPQKIDQEFIQWTGSGGVPIALVFTKADKLKRNELQKNIADYKSFLLETWETLPPVFVTSAAEKKGRSELLTFIGNAMAQAK
jgi:GTP-binding protein